MLAEVSLHNLLTPSECQPTSSVAPSLVSRRFCFAPLTTNDRFGLPVQRLRPPSCPPLIPTPLLRHGVGRDVCNCGHKLLSPKCRCFNPDTLPTSGCRARFHYGLLGNLRLLSPYSLWPAAPLHPPFARSLTQKPKSPHPIEDCRLYF